MNFSRLVEPFFGWVVVAVIIMQALLEWTGVEWVQLPLMVALILMVGMMAISAKRVGRIFLLVCAGLTVAMMLVNDDWQQALQAAVVKTGFLASFFSALAVLREAASASPAMGRAGGFLAAQPPGRRYISLSLGTQIYALLLNFGSIQLLGTLALASGKMSLMRKFGRSGLEGCCWLFSAVSFQHCHGRRWLFRQPWLSPPFPASLGSVLRCRGL